MKTYSWTLVLAGALALSGCGQSGDAAKTGEQADGKAAAPAGWNAADACAVVDKAKMAATAGKPVSEATVGLVHVSSGGGDATTSECSYIFEDGSRGSVMLRWSPIGDNTPDSMALALNTTRQTSEAFGAKVEVVEGLGKSAFWIDKMASMNVFIDDAKFAIITLPTSPSAKEQATKLARDLGA